MREFMRNKCDCLDGAYQFCDICSPPEDIITFAQIMDMAERATKEIESWPQWMKTCFNTAGN